MTIAVGNSTSSVTAGATSITTTPIVVSAGSLVYVVVSQRYPTSPIAVSSVADVNSASYTTIGTNLTNGSDASFDRFYLQNSAGNASFTVTVTMAASVSFAVFVLEIKNAVTSGTVLDATGSSGAGGFGTVSPGSVTLAPGSNGEMMVSCFSSDDFIATIPFAESTGFTIQTSQAVGNANQGNGALATRVVTTGASYNPIWAPGGQQNAAILDSFLSPSPPAITVQPIGQTAAVGATATYAVTATGATSYQWYLAPTIADLYGHVPGTFGSISGATSSSYTTPTLASTDNGNWYYCAVTNAAGTTNTTPVRGWITGLGVSGKGQLMTAWVSDFKQLQTPFSDPLARKTLQFGLDAQAGYIVWGNWLLPALAGIGAGALTEGADVAAGTGATSTSGSSALTEASDVVGAAGSSSTSGSSALTEGHDTAAAAGAAARVGTAAETEGADVVAAAGSSSTSGSGSPTEASDIVAAAGASSTSGAAAVTEGSDVVTAAGVSSTSGSAALTEGSDVVAAAGAATGSGAVGAAAITEASDAPAGAGATSTSGSAAATEGHDTVAAAGSSSTSGAAAVIEGNDAGAGTGATSTSGSAAVTEAHDTAAGTGVASTSGSGSPTESADVASATGAGAAFGVAAIAEQHDAVAAGGGESTTGAAAATESSDAVVAAGSIVVTGSGAVLEQHDSAAGAGSIGGVATLLEGADTATANGTAITIIRARSRGIAAGLPQNVVVMAQFGTKRGYTAPLSALTGV